MSAAAPHPSSESAVQSEAWPLSWDIFCRVIDNHGDLGVCWRLAADLGSRGHAVRLWVDDASALAWMAPAGAPGVTVRPWDEASGDLTPAEVVVEAFGCDPPQRFVAGMARQGRPPLWINLEYLSAEAYVERSHRLPSPQWSGPGRGLTKWFFYPGFTPATGGLLREQGLLERRDLHQATCRAEPDVLDISLFCYAPDALPSLLAALTCLPQSDASASVRGARLHVTPGWAHRQVMQWLERNGGAGQDLPAGSRLSLGTLDIGFLHARSQPEFDRLLWSCDLNLVRGEDSLVRALWAGRPLLWQLYPQEDGAHLDKLEAFLQRYFGSVHDDPGSVHAAGVADLWRAWNGAAQAPSIEGWHRMLAQVRGPWRDLAREASRCMAGLADLGTSLLQFVHERRLQGN